MIFKRILYWVGTLVMVLAVGAGIVYLPFLRGHGNAEEKSTARTIEEIPVTVAQAALRPIERRVEVVGTLEGFEEVNISPKVEGRILRLNYDVGDEVRPGMCLAEIDDTDFRLGVTEAQRGLELELARLGLKEMPTAKVDLSRVPIVLRARNVEENARQSSERARRLGRVMSVEEQEKVTMDFRVAAAAREQAELEAQTYLASARLKLAQLEIAKQKLVDACVTVPTPSPRRFPSGISDPRQIAYVVASRKVAEGEFIRVMPTPILFRLIIDSPLKLMVTVPECYFNEIQLKQKVQLSVESYPDRYFTGEVSRINPTIDRGNRTFSVEVLVPNLDRRLRPGSFVKASILTRESEKTITVPEESIVRFAGVVKIFRVKDGKAQPLIVQPGEVVSDSTGSRMQRWCEVKGDLKPGDLIVTSGHSQLAKDVPVRVRKGGR